MGIRRLFSYLKRHLKIVDLEQYKNLTCGIDGHHFLHTLKPILKKTILDEIPDYNQLYELIAEKLLLMKKLYNITPIVVIDGNFPPIKFNEKEKRRLQREKNMIYVNELIKKKKYEKAAEEKLNSLSFKPPFCKDFHEVLNKYNIINIICPYEGDYELRYLEKKKIIDFIIGNDSDFVAFGCKNVIYDFDFETFKGLRYNQDEYKHIFFNKNFTEEKLLYQCIFRGCDFFSGIDKKLDIITNVIQHNDNYVKIIEKLLGGKNSNKEFLEETIKEFEKTLIIYKYGIIYCPIEKKGKYLNELPQDKNDFVYKYNLDEIVGTIQSPEILYGISCGNIDPITLELLEGNPKPKKSENKKEDENIFKPFFKK